EISSALHPRQPAAFCSGGGHGGFDAGSPEVRRLQKPSASPAAVHGDVQTPASASPVPASGPLEVYKSVPATALPPALAFPESRERSERIESPPIGPWHILKQPDRPLPRQTLQPP